jgi:magnesium chelatase family protein
VKPHEILSQCVAKRAFEVAMVADLSVLLVGPIGTSKSTLRSAFPDVRSDERETCACGHFHDVTRNCHCTERAIIRWYRRFERDARGFDIIIECCAVPAREMLGRNMNTERDTELIYARVAAAREFGRTHTSIALTDDAAARTAEMCLRRLALTPGQWASALRTARAIANLDHSETLKAKHLAEAVQYRADATLYNLDRIKAAGPTTAEKAE